MDRTWTTGRAQVQGDAVARRALFLTVWALLVIVAAWKLLARPTVPEREVTIKRMHVIQEALNRYATDNGGMVPTTRQGLKALRARPTAEAAATMTEGSATRTKRRGADPLPPNWHGPYLVSDELLKDGWGRPFQYAAPGGFEPTPKGVDPVSRPYDLWSLGADGREGGTGADASICSWEAQTQVP